MEKISPEKELSEQLRDATRETNNLAGLPLAYARAIRANTTHLDSQVRKRALELIRAWVTYAEKHAVSEKNLFSIRYHITKFAAENFDTPKEKTTLREVSIAGINAPPHEYSNIIDQAASKDILTDPAIAVVGGTARLALKMHAGVSWDDELPLNDIDAVISASSDVTAVAKKYAVDLTGAKIVDGNLRDALPGLITNFDCTMNQVAVYEDALLFSEQALKDIKEGNIRIIGKSDPLFGSEGERMPDGNVYIYNNGFYRGLSFLLRGKGKRFIVSRENIEQEKDAIGRYWLVMLFVKLLPMKKADARKSAIAHWYDIAYRIGATKTMNPTAFLEEQLAQYPEMKFYNQESHAYDAEAQVRWLIGKLTKKAAYAVYGPTQKSLPATYTESAIELSPDVMDFDIEKFMEAVRQAT